MLTNEFERELMAALHGIQTALEAINATLAAQARSGPWTVTSAPEQPPTPWYQFAPPSNPVAPVCPRCHVPMPRVPDSPPGRTTSGCSDTTIYYRCNKCGHEHASVPSSGMLPGWSWTFADSTNDTPGEPR